MRFDLWSESIKSLTEAGNRLFRPDTQSKSLTVSGFIRTPGNPSRGNHSNELPRPGQRPTAETGWVFCQYKSDSPFCSTQSERGLMVISSPTQLKKETRAACPWDQGHLSIGHSGYVLTALPFLGTPTSCKHYNKTLVIPERILIFGDGFSRFLTRISRE